jgi:hypothetical protein
MKAVLSWYTGLSIIIYASCYQGGPATTFVDSDSYSLAPHQQFRLVHKVGEVVGGQVGVVIQAGPSGAARQVNRQHLRRGEGALTSTEAHFSPCGEPTLCSTVTHHWIPALLLLPHACGHDPVKHDPVATSTHTYMFAIERR